MATVSSRRTRRRRPARSAVVASPPPALDFDDRDALRAWISDLAAAIEDATGVTADQLAPFRERHLGPAEARRLYREAKGRLHDLLDQAKRGLVARSRAGVVTEERRSPGRERRS